MKHILRGIAVVFLVIFVLTLPLSLAIIRAETLLFDEQVYWAAFERAQPESELPALAARAVAQRTSISLGSYGSLQGVLQQPFQDMLQALVKPEQFRELASDLLAQSLQYMQQKTNTVVIDLEPFRGLLQTPQGFQAFNQFLASYPKCTGQQLESMLVRKTLVDSGGIIMLCRGPREYHSAHGTLFLADLLPGEFQLMTAGMPAQLVLLQAPPSSADFRLQIEPARQKVRYVWLLPLVSLLLASALAVRSLRAWLKWWGVPLLIAGMLGWLAGRYGISYATLQLGSQLQSQLAALPVALPAFVVGFLQDVLRSIVAQSFDFMASCSQYVVIGGAFMLVISIILDRVARPVRAPLAPQA